MLQGPAEGCRSALLPQCHPGVAQDSGECKGPAWCAATCGRQGHTWPTGLQGAARGRLAWHWHTESLLQTSTDTGPGQS